MGGFMSAAISPLPSPSVPWHTAQSCPKIFLDLAMPSAVGFTGFTNVAASAGIVPEDEDDAGCCDTSATTASAGANNTSLNMVPPKCRANLMPQTLPLQSAMFRPPGEDCL